MSSFEDVLDRIISKGDMGVAFLGFAAGYVIGFKLGLLGLSPEKAGVVVAAAGVGLKNFCQSAGGGVAKRLRYWRIVREVARLSRHEHAAPLQYQARQVQSDYELWRKGLIPESALYESIRDFAIAYRKFAIYAETPSRGTRGTAVKPEPLPPRAE